MHVPQSLQTRYELEWITLVPTQIFTPQGGQGIISLVFDSLTGMYRFSRGNKPLSKDIIQNLLMVHPHWNGKVLPADMSDGTEWSPSAMYSMILPEFSYKGKNMAYGNDPIPENEIVIEKGLVRHGGIFDVKILGTNQDAMMKTIAFWYGNWAAKNYIDSTQQMVNDWLSTSGLSVGIGDVIAPPDILERITQEVRTGIHNVNQILSQAHHGLLEPNLQSKYFFDALELKVRNALKTAEDKITKILEEFLSPENRFLEMIACGGRGKKVNLMQTTGVVGQQITDNSRTKFHYTARTLPHFTKDDFGAESRGFVMHSFTQGLAPHEFFFHQMSSREGTIDTAIKSVSGDTPIILIENDNARYVEIGEWIDNLLKQYPEEIEKHPEHNQELLKTKAKTLIPTTDEFGKIHWGEVTAVTRHDPGQKMYQVKTQSGREVKVVESKSLIIWDETLNQFKEVPTSSVQVGDFLPVSFSLPNTQESNLDDTTIQELIQRQMKDGYASIQVDSQEEMNKIGYYCARHGLWTILEPYKIQIQENPSQEYRIVENVVLDPIISIEELDVNDYPKVYDITVPSTLNFGLANGLQVRDTADVGYIQRRLIKAMEDIHVAYDLTLRTAAKTILQFRYGDDGYEPTKIQKQNLDLFDKSYTQMRKEYEITDAEWATWEKMLAGDMKKQWKKNQQNEKEVAQKAYEELVQIQRRLREVDFKYAPTVEFAKTFNCPVHFPRLIQKIKDFHPMGGAIELLPSEVQRALDTVIQELRAFMPDMTLHRFEAQLRSMISVKRCVLSERWSRDAFATCIQQVKEYFLKGICQPGEMIGTLTAEMIGEPLTQLTLNTFHLAGRGDTGSVTTTGVPRMKEIVNLAKDIKTPSMTLFLKEPWRSDINRAKELKSILEYTKLGDLVIQSRILFDPLAKALETEENQHRTSGGIDFEEEDEFTRLYYSFAEAVGFPAPDPQTSSPWVLRMEFDRDKMVARNITMADIRRVLTMNQELNQDIEISFSDDNAGDLVMRVRVSAIQEDTDPISFLQTLEHKHLMQVTIQGIQGIQRCSVENEYSIFYDADGKPEMKKENVIKTIGVNVFEVLMMDFIDAERMLCNDIHTVKEIFGIEAARSLLLHEFGVLLSGSVPDLNYRHISVVCDVMAYRGDLMSIDRHGLKRSPDISPFAKASNEESVEILVNAGVFADTDRMTGVSSNILMGQEPVGGTNAFELLLDESQLVEKMEVQMPDHSPDTLYEEVGEATTWGAEDEEDVVEEVVEVANPEYQGFLADDPFTVQWDGDRLDRLGRLEVETTVPRPPLFKSTENWIQKDE